MASLELNNISYTYPGSDRPALDGVSLRVEPGGITAILGDNSSGKSTLAKIAAGLIRPDSGAVNIVSEQDNASNDVRLLFQNPDEQLITESVRHELAWGLENLGLTSAEMERRVEAGLATYNLIEIADHPPEMLSDGQKQLVVFASMILMNPACLILDEATAFLDPHWKESVWQRAKEFSRQSALLWITTSRREAERADNLLTLSEGQLRTI